MKTPQAPDPVATSQAQAGFNRDTATSQNLINMTNQVNPWGSTTYDPTGSASFVDSTGKTITVPQYTQTTTFSPEQQQIFDKSQQAQSNIAGIASDQSARLGQYLNEPFEFNNQDAADWSYDLAQSRIAPQRARQEEALRTRLVNSGIRPGTQAWDSEMSRLSMANTDQDNQLALTGRAQAFSEALANRNQPINEITALLSGSQVSNPAQMSGATPQSSVGGVDYTGLVNQNYQAKVSQNNAMLGGLFGLAGAGIQGATMLSDIRAKVDISQVGQLDNGLPVYSYRYASGGPFHIGLIAQEVRAVNPDAVEEIAGMLHVNYDKAVR